MQYKLIETSYKKTLDQLTDEEIMQLISNGNLDLMSKLFDRYYSKIYNFIVKTTGSRDIGKDLTQDTFYKVLRHRKTYNGTKFSTWIYTIAKNLCTDFYKAKKVNTISLDTINYEPQDLNGSSIEKNERDEKLYYALQQLNIEDRQLLIMNRFQNIRYAEISEITGIRPGTLKTKLHRALHKLRGYYFKKCEV